MNQQKFIGSYTESIISHLSQDETGKRQYYRPIYSLHKWWARRPGALFRAIILLAQAKNNELFTSIHNGTFSTSSLYFKGDNLENVTILDPFMGGGTTLVEASRLGAKVIGCDLNPVAHWIVRETLKPISLERLNNYFSLLSQTVGQKVKKLYKTTCPQCKQQCDTLYAFWVRYVSCPGCGADVYLFKRSLLNEGRSRNKPVSSSNLATVFCPACFALNEWDGSNACICSACHSPFNPETGTYEQGYFDCRCCGQKHISLIETLAHGQKLHEKLMAIEYLCECRKDRFYKPPDPSDFINMQTIEETVRNQWAELCFPKQEILPGDSSVRWRRHNYRYYYEVFNARQLLALHYLIEGIKEISEEEYRNAFLTILSNSLEYNNMMTPYNYPHRKLHHLFNYHAMPLTTTPVENAVWGVGEEGAGTFINCYGRYLRAKRYCQKPFDKFKDAKGVVHTVEQADESISVNFVSSFEQLKQTPHGTFLLCGDSSQLPDIPTQSIDFVITDPPYFDSIHYSELSNFFYVWLKCAVNSPFFASEHVPTAKEAIVNGKMEKGEKEYQSLLTAVFQESNRVLKTDGKLIFTFHHTKWRAWWTILSAVAESGFNVIDSFPVLSEYKVNPHIRNKQSLDMDLVLVCQKTAVPTLPLSLSPTDILQRATHHLTDNLPHHHNNKLFLYFMGELLKTASFAWGGNKINYDWFADALTHFDDFLLTLEQNKPSITYEPPQPRQLRLLEA